MLYVYHGEDIDTARKKVQATVSNLLAKNPDALYFRITTDSIHEYDFDELTQGQALFKSEYIVLLDSLLSQKEGELIVLENLEKITRAGHPFFILEGKLTAPVQKKLEKCATKTHLFETTKTKKQDTFNTFSLTDALGERNVRKLWTLFRTAKCKGVSDEEIHGILFWMWKSLLLAAQSQTPEQAGMKAYPFNKAKRFLKNFSSIDELQTFTTQWALLPQVSRRKGVSLEIELEHFILSL